MHWCFTKLTEVIRDIKNLAFVTALKNSIINGITKAFPDAHHGYKKYHIQGSMKTKNLATEIVLFFEEL